MAAPFSRVASRRRYFVRRVLSWPREGTHEITFAALAATLAGIAFSNAAVAVVHALEYPLGGVVHCSHGAGNGLLLPYVMRFNLPARVKEFAAIARMLGEDTNGLSEQAAAEKAIQAVAMPATASAR